jgi:UDP:flavonoid glycosyltransferase YjiC (YdhE family)
LSNPEYKTKALKIKQILETEDKVKTAREAIESL